MFTESEKTDLAVKYIVEQEEKGNSLELNEPFIFSVDDGSHVTLILHSIVTEEMRSRADQVIADRQTRDSVTIQKVAAYIVEDEKANKRKYAVGDPFTLTYRDTAGTLNTLMTVVTDDMRNKADLIASKQ